MTCYMFLSIKSHISPSLSRTHVFIFILGQILMHILNQKLAINVSSPYLTPTLFPLVALLESTHLVLLDPGSFPSAFSLLPSSSTLFNTVHFHE